MKELPSHLKRRWGIDWRLVWSPSSPLYVSENESTFVIFYSNKFKRYIISGIRKFEELLKEWCGSMPILPNMNNNTSETSGYISVILNEGEENEFLSFDLCPYYEDFDSYENLWAFFTEADFQNFDLTLYPLKTSDLLETLEHGCSGILEDSLANCLPIDLNHLIGSFYLNILPLKTGIYERRALHFMSAYCFVIQKAIEDKIESKINFMDLSLNVVINLLEESFLATSYCFSTELEENVSIFDELFNILSYAFKAELDLLILDEKNVVSDLFIFKNKVNTINKVCFTELDTRLDELKYAFIFFCYKIYLIRKTRFTGSILYNQYRIKLEVNALFLEVFNKFSSFETVPTFDPIKKEFIYITRPSFTVYLYWKYIVIPQYTDAYQIHLASVKAATLNKLYIDW